jgi:hypothetical protein
MPGAGRVGRVAGVGSAPQALTRRAARINITNILRFIRNSPSSIKDHELSQ